MFVELHKFFLEGKIRLFELVFGVAAPVDGGLVYGDVDKVLAELHHNDFVVFGMGVEEGADGAGGVQLSLEDVFGQGVLIVVELKTIVYLAE